ncbi:MAG: hypothetical protein AMJ81_04105 [Phycisphaerae bacterium SM23_33]|nr:MAG: hypothetical protein AMJ81_04105 [Phycisphaerae bacterium SM23_33]
MHYLEELSEGLGGPAGGAAEAAAEMESLIGPAAAGGQARGRRADNGPLSSMADLPMAPAAGPGKLLVDKASAPAWPRLPAERASDQSAEARPRRRAETASRDGHQRPLEAELEALAVPSLWVLKSAV